MNRKISRRKFTGLSFTAIAGTAAVKNFNVRVPGSSAPNSIPLGGPVFGDYKEPGEWIRLLRAEGYSASFCPVPVGTAPEIVKDYEKAAKNANIIISEVGVWNNPIAKGEEERKNALKKCKESLALADLIGANCCVNISGSRGELWDGPDKDNYTEETFEMIVATTREIIDEVKPVRTYFTLETMPWALPDSPDSYLDLIKAIDRKQFAVHLDPVNMINSPRRYYNTGAFIRECFARLGPYIRNCHGKDILLSTRLTVHLDEVVPGTGGLDYRVFLTELSRLKGIPLMIEHLKTAEQYRQAADNIRRTGKSAGISFC